MALPTLGFAQSKGRVASVIVLAVFSFLAILAVILRLWARRIQRNVWETSDYLIILGLYWSLAESVFTMHSYIYWDLGGDLTQIGNPHAILRYVILQVKALLIGIILWACAVFFIRASILALYIRIFRTESFRIACYAVLGVNAAFFITNILASILVCRPIAYNWDSTIPGGTCGDQKSLDLYIGIFNLLMDICVVILPMPVLWGLQMAINKKLVLSVMFGLGIIICIITLVRIRITVQNHGSNSQHIYSLIALFTCLEALLGIVNACLPVMRPLFTKMLDCAVSNWLSSVMSGTIPVFMRPSQMGSWKSTNVGSTRHSTSKPPPTPKEMHHWHGLGGGSRSSRASVAPAPPPPPRYVENKPANMMFAPTYKPVSSPAVASPRPPVPPKGPYYSTVRRWEPADEKDAIPPEVFVQRSWIQDVERGADSEETDRQLLKESPREEFENYNRW